MRGAIAAAAFAAEAPVERFLPLLARPAVLDHLAAQHLGEQARAAARGVALLAGCAVARAHGGAARRAALAHADAVLGGADEAVADLAPERKDGLRRRRLVIRAEAQVRIRRVGVDELSRVHAVARIPDRLELAKRLHQLGAEHPRQELGFRLAVAVLAG